MAPRVYLAGPEVFLPDAATVGEAKRRACAEAGLVGVFPLDAEAGLDALADRSGAERAGHVFAAAVRLLDSCDAVIANLTPFRGVSADVGTAWELGHAFARGKVLFAYTNEPGHYADRVGAGPHAADGLAVEDFDLADNLMLESSVLASGGLVVRGGTGGTSGAAAVTAADGPAGRVAGLDAFVACVALAAAALGAGPAGGDR